MTELEDLAKRICGVLDDGGNLLAGSAMHSMLKAALKEVLAKVPAPDGRLHVDGYFTWARRDGYVQDAKLPCDFYLALPHSKDQP